MTTKDFTANVISATKVVPDGNFKDSKASGIWDINEALDLIKGGNWPNAANINPSALVDGLFSTDLYDGTGANQTITNNINLSGSGGLVWLKSRDGSTSAFHTIYDTERGTGPDGGRIFGGTAGNNATSTQSDGLQSFNSGGFTLGANLFENGTNSAYGTKYCSWTFRKQPKFFDIVTYTGNGSNQNISHNLGTTPGFVMVKKTSGTGNWSCWHRSLDSDDYILLNTTGAAVAAGGSYNRTVNSTTYQVFGDYSDEGTNAATYVMYLFAHNDDDGGFGAAGDQDIINCGSYTGNGNATGPVVNLGFEPQWLLVKDATSSNDWFIWDVMRGFPANVANSLVSLNPNTTDAEQAEYGTAPQPTGFQVTDNNAAINTNNSTYIYMAIRRGGMQTPTAASDVFDVDISTQAINSSNAPPRTPFVVDMGIYRDRNTDGASTPIFARLQGANYLQTSSADAEGSGHTTWDQMDGWGISNASWESSANYLFYNWKRARGYFDVVTYSGSGSARTLSHNLAVVPEMMWIKRRTASADWQVYHSALGNAKELHLNNNEAEASSSKFNSTDPTSSVFSVGTATSVNRSTDTYIAMLFATLANVSKVGSFTQSGATNVACGFTGDTPSFILLKRTDSTGDWLHYDSARGIVAGDDKSLDLNTTDVEVTADLVDPYSGGFATTSSLANGDYIFYAIASIA